MPPTRLDLPDAIPPQILRRLQSYQSVFQSTTSMDAVLRTSGMSELQDDLQTVLLGGVIWGYHCTKEPKSGFFETEGLRLTDLRNHQTQFLRDHGHCFSAQEKQILSDGWERQFHRDRMALEGRNRKVWMCLSRPGWPHDGTERFFEYFGGEAIYWPFVHGQQHASIASKLRAIGSPVVVEVAVPAADLVRFGPIARYVLECHHQRLNPSVRRPDAEAYVERDLAPEEVIQVTPRRSFVP